MKSLPSAAVVTGIAVTLLFGASASALAAGSRQESATASTREATDRRAARPSPDSDSAETTPRKVPLGGGVDGTVDDGYPDFVDLPGIRLPPKGTPPPQYRVSAPSPFAANCD